MKAPLPKGRVLTKVPFTIHCADLGYIFMILDTPGVAKTVETMASMSRMNMDVDIIMDMAVSMNLNEAGITTEDVLKELPFMSNSEE